KGGDTSTTNYDAVAAALNLQAAPDGLLIHTAGFDHDAGVFRIFDVWTTREQGERFIKDQLGPIIGSMATAAQSPDNDFAPPSRGGSACGPKAACPGRRESGREGCRRRGRPE